VVLTLDGQVQDENFLRFLEKVGVKTLAFFSTEDFLVLDLIHREKTVPTQLKDRLKQLTDIGIIERDGRGKGTKYMLCRKYYKFSGQTGVYTRRRGLDKATNKELLLKHIKENADTGSKLSDLCQVLPALSRNQVHRLAKALNNDGLIEFKGKTKASRWFPMTR